jgi:hypothetical protein
MLPEMENIFRIRLLAWLRKHPRHDLGGGPVGIQTLRLIMKVAIRKNERFKRRRLEVEENPTQNSNMSRRSSKKSHNTLETKAKGINLLLYNMSSRAVHSAVTIEYIFNKEIWLHRNTGKASPPAVLSYKQLALTVRKERESKNIRSVYTCTFLVHTTGTAGVSHSQSHHSHDKKKRRIMHKNKNLTVHSLVGPAIGKQLIMLYCCRQILLYTRRIFH